MNSLITHLTNDHLRNFIVHLRIVNFFFCLVYYLPDPAQHAFQVHFNFGQHVRYARSLFSPHNSLNYSSEAFLLYKY